MTTFCCFNVGNLMRITASQPEGGPTISASVGAGGNNFPPDVIAIQALLNIVGAAPPLVVDGLVGLKTIAAIRTFQTKQFGSADGLIDPKRRTLARLSVLAPSDIVTSRAPIGSRLAVTAPAQPAAPPAAMTPLQAAIDVTPRAILWVNAAITHLSFLRTAIIAAGGDMNLILPFVMQTANTHFHLDRDESSVLVNIDRIIRVFQRILRMLGDPDKFFTEGPANDKSPFADAAMGGFDMKNVKITFRTKYPTCGPNVRAAMLVHEGAHFCGQFNEINHFAMEFPAPNGQPQDGSTHNYAQLTTEEAMKNASSYAAFSIHAFFNSDLRFGAADLTK